MKYPLVTPGALSRETRQFLDQLNSQKNLSQLQKAKILEKYVQKTFLYSLDTRWADYYQQAGSINDFIVRIFEMRKTDCDVANTALIALLRNQGIPARIAFGYATPEISTPMPPN